MQLSKLITYSFSPNVGPVDRNFRVISGLALIIAPWFFPGLPDALALGLSIFGLAWLMTGALSRCGFYYLFGWTTR